VDCITLSLFYNKIMQLPLDAGHNVSRLLYPAFALMMSINYIMVIVCVPFEVITILIFMKCN